LGASPHGRRRMRTDLAEFWRIVEEASVVKVDGTGQFWAPEFRVERS